MVSIVISCHSVFAFDTVLQFVFLEMTFCRCRGIPHDNLRACLAAPLHTALYILQQDTVNKLDWDMPEGSISPNKCKQNNRHTKYKESLTAQKRNKKKTFLSLHAQCGVCCAQSDE